MGGGGNCQRNFKNLIFSKVPKLFTHDMGYFGTGMGMLFHLCKGFLVTHEVFEKIEKRQKKLLYSSSFSVRAHKIKQQFFPVFFDFLKDFVCDKQTLIEVKQHPQAGPETTHTMCDKFGNF